MALAAFQNVEPFDTLTLRKGGRRKRNRGYRGRSRKPDSIHGVLSVTFKGSDALEQQTIIHRPPHVVKQRRRVSELAGLPLA
jgi:hypothetical protein